MILEALDEVSATEYQKRSRALFEATHQVRKTKMDAKDADDFEKALVLNEVFSAEKDTGSASRYRIR